MSPASFIVSFILRKVLTKLSGGGKCPAFILQANERMLSAILVINRSGKSRKERMSVMLFSLTMVIIWIELIRIIENRAADMIYYL